MLSDPARKLFVWDKSISRLADLTVGGGGHLRIFLENSPPPAEIFAVDRDLEALEFAKLHLKDIDDSRVFLGLTPIRFVHSTFTDFLKSEKSESLDRVFADLGVSSFQLDQSRRGFSFREDGPLDMRMDQSRGNTASDLLMQCDEVEIARILYEFGEERRSRSIAKKIVFERQKGRITTTKELVELLGFRLDSKDRKGRHPLTAIFQALRIAVNGELDAVQALCDEIPRILSTEGLFGILTFHSLEDRAVKWGMRGKLKQIHKKAIQATDEEEKENPRARSAKLRVFEKVRPV